MGEKIRYLFVRLEIRRESRNLDQQGFPFREERESRQFAYSAKKLGKSGLALSEDGVVGD